MVCPMWNNREKHSLLLQIPIMVQSRYCRLKNMPDQKRMKQGECRFDMGGYFIVNGSEKVMVAQERQAYNRVYCFDKKGGKYSWIAEVRSQLEHSNRPLTEMKVMLYRKGGGEDSAANQIRVKLPKIKQEIPVVVLFRALGFANDRQILSHIVYDFSDTEMLEAFRPSLEEARPIQTVEQAKSYIGARGDTEEVSREGRIQHATDILQKDLLPHVGVEASTNDRTRKCYFLGYVVHRLLQCHLGRAEADDRDHFGNKRLDLAGPLLGSLFRQLFYQVTKEMRMYLQKCMDRNTNPNVSQSIRHHTITSKLKYALATGNWTVHKGIVPPKTGVSQVLQRLTYTATLSHLRRLNTPLEREGKRPEPRLLHNTHWGMMCPCETPEGQAVGLVKNLSLMAYVSVGSSVEPVLQLLDDWGMYHLEDVNPASIPASTKIFVNGNWIGIVPDPDVVVDAIRDQRRLGELEYEVSVYRNIADQEIHVFTDAGRVCRPLFIVDTERDNITGRRYPKLRIKSEHIEHIHELKEEALHADEEHVPLPEDHEARNRFSQLVEKGLIEYVDTLEEGKNGH